MKEEATGRYYLHYDYGIHHTWVSIDQFELQKILNNLSTEFEIHQEDPDNIYIINYYGDKHYIAKRVLTVEDL